MFALKVLAGVGIGGLAGWLGLLHGPLAWRRDDRREREGIEDRLIDEYGAASDWNDDGSSAR